MKRALYPIGGWRTERRRIMILPEAVAARAGGDHLHWPAITLKYLFHRQPYVH